MYQWQRAHIFSDLSLHNCNITVFNPLLYNNTNEANEKLINHLNKEHYDLFMTCHTEKDLYIETLLDIKRKLIPTLLICFDNLTVPFNHKKICKYFDIVWLTSKETQYLFDIWGANSIFLPYAANPMLCNPVFDVEIPKVLFIGTVYGSRAKMINDLLKNNIQVSLYTGKKGSTPNNHEEFDIKVLIKAGICMLSYKIGRRLFYASLKNKLLKQSVLDINNSLLEINSPLSLLEMMDTYSRYALSLSSISNRHTGVLKNPVNIVNLRSFEIPAAGGLQFCRYSNELAEYFEEGKEAIYYRTEDEMIDKSLFYLSEKQSRLRLEMKEKARYRVEHEHTWFCRFKKVFDELGLLYNN